MADTLTLTNPEQNYEGSGGKVAAVPVPYFVLNAEVQAVSILVAFVREDVLSLYIDEDDDTNNPLQLRSTGLLDRDGTRWFDGFVVTKNLFRSYDEGNFFEITLWGKEGVLAETLAKDSTGDDVWSVATSSVLVTDLPLEVTSSYGNFAGDTLWPDPLDAVGVNCYVQDSDSNQDTLDTTIDIAASVPFDVILSTTDKAFLPRGWIKIGTEFMFYDGYDDTAAGSKHRCNVTARAQLGTTAATHTGGAATVYNKVAKNIAPGVTKITEDGTRLRFRRQYFPQPQLGCFLLAGAAGGSTYLGTYKIYDDDSTLDGGSTQATVNEIVKSMCKAAAEVAAPDARKSGGAGFEDSDLDFDDLGLILTRYDYNPEDKPPYAWDAIHDLFGTVGLGKEIVFFYDHGADKLRLAYPGNGSVLVTLAHVEKVEQEFSSEEVYSAVRVPWKDDQPLNRIHEDFANHVGAAASGAKPDFWFRTDSGGESWDRGDNTEDNGAADSNFGVEAIRDGDPASKLTAYFEHDPGGEFVFGDFWFGSGVTPPPLDLDKIAMRINNYRAIEGWNRTTDNADFEYVVRVDGCSDYNTSTNTGTWEELGFVIEGKPFIDGVPILHEARNFIKRTVNAIRIVFEFMAGDKRTGDFYTASVHDLIVEGSTTDYVYVQTSDSTQNDKEFIYAPDTHNKLRGGVKAANAGAGVGGSPKVYNHPNIGGASEDAAYSVARTVAKIKLATHAALHVEYKGILPAANKPELLDTWKVQQGGGIADFTGYIRGYSIVKSMSVEKEGGTDQTLSLKLFDSNVGVIT